MARSTTKKTKSENAQLAGLVEGTKGMTLLGSVVTWTDNVNRGKKNTFAETVQALKDCTLDEKEAKEFLPQTAWARAINKLKEDRSIEIIRNDQDEALFQFTKFTSVDDGEDGDKELEYKKETKVLLNKKTGKLTCKKDNIREQAQKLLDNAMEERTSSDISFIVNRLFEKHGDLIPMGAGVYFVPEEYAPFVDKVYEFLSKLGRRMNRLPVPAGTQYGDKTIADVVKDRLMDLTSAHMEAIKNFTNTTRPGTVEERATQLNNTRVKLEAYRHYLSTEGVEEITRTLDEGDKLLISTVNTLFFDGKMDEEDPSKPIPPSGNEEKKEEDAA